MRAAKMRTRIRQEQIAEAALRLVARQGMKGLSVARVARRVGVVPSAIYRHYSSKDEVLDAVLDLIRDRLLGNVKAVCEESTEALDHLHRLLIRHVRLLRENQGIPRVVFSQELHHGHSGRKARMYETIREYLGQVAEIARQGQQNGQVCSGFTPEAVSTMFLGIVQPAALLRDLSDGDFDVTRHAESAWQILDAAIRPVKQARAAGATKRKEK
ncbi:MAG TPA: TetR/AcrR family transcriptional regulator [Phycisphaerae bacterium]|nr:TetR/AcrR family transcriptional regulator [Phycisphaerae bacterium]HRY70048.1 TetR/AcrR family transcriptional regulator [Phycisphaerae bacterium]